jgi:hypothetical protein
MKHFRLKLAAVVAPALTLALILGCGSKDNKGTTDGAGSGESGTSEGGGSAKKPIEAAKRGTIKGKVTLAGNRPDADISNKQKTLEEAMKKHENRDTCLSGSADEKSQQTWKIDDKGGIENVVVYLKAPKGYYFKVTDEDIKSVKDVTIDQPHCAFIPHVVTLFPSYFDGKSDKPTGQKFLATNSSPIGHNTKYQGIRTKGANLKLSSKQTEEMKVRVEDAPVVISCDIHTWMNAYARVFDHPFAAVTKPDGTYEIKNVPLDVDVQVVAWHETGAYGEGGADGQKKKLKDGEEVDFTITPK